MIEGSQMNFFMSNTLVKEWREWLRHRRYFEKIIERAITCWGRERKRDRDATMCKRHTGHYIDRQGISVLNVTSSFYIISV